LKTRDTKPIKSRGHGAYRQTGMELRIVQWRGKEKETVLGFPASNFANDYILHRGDGIAKDTTIEKKTRLRELHV
jgi:hypothetical protein